MLLYLSHQSIGCPFWWYGHSMVSTISNHKIKYGHILLYTVVYGVLFLVILQNVLRLSFFILHSFHLLLSSFFILCLFHLLLSSFLILHLLFFRWACLSFNILCDNLSNQQHHPLTAGVPYSTPVWLGTDVEGCNGIVIYYLQSHTIILKQVMWYLCDLLTCMPWSWAERPCSDAWCVFFSAKRSLFVLISRMFQRTLMVRKILQCMTAHWSSQCSWIQSWQI